MTTDYPAPLKNFFNELEARRTLITAVADAHTKLLNHFTSLDATLAAKSQTLDTQIEKFKSHTGETLEDLRIRENSIPEKEAAWAARVEQLKDSAIRDIESGGGFGREGKTMSEWLKMWFRRMDSNGLLSFLWAKRKESGGVRAQIDAATAEAVDLLGFLLGVVDAFVRLKLSGEKVTGMADRRWACGVLVQVCLPLAGRVDLGGVSGSLKERAMAVLGRWRGVLGDGEGRDGVGSGEATMFLHMVIGFGLKERFEDGFLKGLVLEFAGRRGMAKLAVALGFGEGMKDIIEELVKTGKEIEAIYFAYEAGLTDVFPPVSLLKSSLKKCRKTSKGSTSKGDSLLKRVNNELTAIRAIIKCVEEHKLESEFSVADLQEQVAELEKIKAEQKAESAAPVAATKPLGKRARVGGSARPPKAVRLAIASAASHQVSRPPPLPSPIHQPPPVGYLAPYNYTSPSVYESGPTATVAPFGAGYGGGGAYRQSGYGGGASPVPTYPAATYRL